MTHLQGEPPAQRQAHEQAQRQVQQLLAADAATRSLGIALSAIAPGQATATMMVTESMLQGHGTCHGGYVFLLADTAFAFACNTRGDAVVAAGADVQFLAPARKGDVLVAQANERVVTGRSGIFDVTVRRGEQVICEFRGRSRSLPAERPA